MYTSEDLIEMKSWSLDRKIQLAQTRIIEWYEKWNGNGYPEGLVGKEIPFSARIMAIADVFDAISAKRCYRDAMPLDKCFAIIKEGKGVDFDPVLTDLFLNAREKVEKVCKESQEG